MPLRIVPKPRSDKLRMVNDHIAGEFSLNSMISRAHTALKLDGIQELGASIRKDLNNGDRDLCLFIADVRGAYCLMPLHPLCQICQITQVDGALHVDQCTVFGNMVSGNIFESFMGLVIWIAIFVKTP